MRRLVVVGDTLLDHDVVGSVERLCPEAPVPVVDQEEIVTRPGGAGLAAALAAADGREIVLVTALADDSGARDLRALLAAAGVEVVDLGFLRATPEKIRIRARGHLLLRIDRGGPARPARGALPPRASAALREADAVLVADYGRGIASAHNVRAALAAVASRLPVVWDPHPRGNAPVSGVSLATPNRAEAARELGVADAGTLKECAERAESLRSRWSATAVAITLGGEGALLVEGNGTPFCVRAKPAPNADSCGAGDRFAATAASLLGDGALTSEAVEAAVRAASAFVAAGGAGALDFGSESTRQRDSLRVRLPSVNRNGLRRQVRRGESPEALSARVRARGGTVVATGGCFDLIHAGHVALLKHARTLGECLLVLVNTDSSVRRLKGVDRPLVSEEDRVAVLQALEAVDAVVLFDELTPERALRRLRPHFWVKGGDYTHAELPEARVLQEWEGQAVVLPYFPGRSTTRLIAEAQARG